MTKFLIAVALTCATVALADPNNLPAGNYGGSQLASRNQLIVFVCPYGSAKSVVAARFFNRMVGERSGYHAVARGIEPEAKIPDYVRYPIRKDGFEIGANEKPVPLDLGEIRSAAAVVCIKCKLPLRYAALARQELHWSDVPDFEAGYDAARDKIVAHLKEFMAHLAKRSQ